MLTIFQVIGEVVKVGDKVTKAKVGQRVGVGAQIGACLECNICKSDNEVSSISKYE